MVAGMRKPVSKASKKPMKVQKAMKKMQKAMKVKGNPSQRRRHFMMNLTNPELGQYEMYKVRGMGGIEILACTQAARRRIPQPTPSPSRGACPNFALNVRYYKKNSGDIIDGVVTGGTFVKWVSASQARAIRKRQ